MVEGRAAAGRWMEGRSIGVGEELCFGGWNLRREVRDGNVLGVGFSGVLGSASEEHLAHRRRGNKARRPGGA
jgi:hypothetical protein